MASARPVTTIESLCREVQAQIVLVIDLQAPREIITVPRAYIEGWYNMLARVIVLTLTED